MKSNVRNIIVIVIAIVLALIIAPFLMHLAGQFIRIAVIIVLAYIFFIVLKQLIK